MKTTKLYLDFSAYNPAELTVLGDRVTNALNDKETYPNPVIPAEELATANGEFKEAIDAAATGDRVAIRDRNQKREVLVRMLRQVGLYVQAVVDGDDAKLAASGFEVSVAARKPAVLDKPLIETVENRASRELAVSLRRVRGAKAYEVRMSHGPEGWQMVGVFTQARNILLTDLTPGQTYTVQVRAIGAGNTTTDWSDPVSRMSL
ncbi:MAG TPA: fibronectin type III domain-containing protein [Verrucomicrobiae bacterium]|nr:fibronectin type III domain-containing protein [Verrucomicrobiae bacterium]